VAAAIVCVRGCRWSTRRGQGDTRKADVVTAVRGSRDHDRSAVPAATYCAQPADLPGRPPASAHMFLHLQSTASSVRTNKEHRKAGRNRANSRWSRSGMGVLAAESCGAGQGRRRAHRPVIGMNEPTSNPRQPVKTKQTQAQKGTEPTPQSSGRILRTNRTQA
jgi:hypothetical protein